MEAQKLLHNALIGMIAQEKVPAFTIVVNCTGDSDRSPNCPNCGSWIQHWHTLSGERIPVMGDCATLGCDGRTEDGKPAPIVGCHVRIANAPDHSEYVAPLCQCCNNKHGAKLILSRSTTLVRANVSETCSKLMQ